MPQQHSTPKPERPWLIIILAIVVLFVAAIHWTKFIMAIQQWDAIESAPTLVSPLYLALIGLGWGIACLPLVWGLWKGKPWAWLGMQIVGVFYALATWADLLWIADPDFVQTRWPFSLGLSLLGLGFLFVAVYHPASRHFFNKTS